MAGDDNEDTFLDAIDWDYSHLDLIGLGPGPGPSSETTSLLMKELDELKPVSAGIKAHPRPRNVDSGVSGPGGAGGSWESVDGGPGLRSLDKHHSEPHNVARAILQAVKNRRSSSKSTITANASFSTGGGQTKSTGSTPKKGSLFQIGRTSRASRAASHEETAAAFSEPEASTGTRSNGHGPAHGSPAPHRSSGDFARSRLAKRLQLDLDRPAASANHFQQRLQRYSKDYSRNASNNPTSSHNGGFHIPENTRQPYDCFPQDYDERKKGGTVIHHQAEVVEQGHQPCASGLVARDRSSISPVEEIRSNATPVLYRHAPRATVERSMDSGELSPKPGPSGLTFPSSISTGPSPKPPRTKAGLQNSGPDHGEPYAARRSWTSSTTGEEEHLLGGFRESPPKAASVGLPIDTIDSATSGDEEAVADQSGRTSVKSSGTCRAEVGEPSTSRPVQRREAPAGVALPSCCASVSPDAEAFLEFRGRFATSYRLEGAGLRSPVDLCLLPNDCLAVADYDNGFLLLSPSGDLLRHHCPLPENKNACGILCTMAEGEFRLLVLVYKEGMWAINVYNWCFDLVEVIHCPHDAQIETWAMRKMALGETVSGASGEEPGTAVTAVFLMATGESKTVVWAREVGGEAEWEMMISESGRRGPYNDFDVRLDGATGELSFLLVDWKKAQLSTVLLNSSLQLVDTHTIRIRRVKGQEWVVQGPKLASWDTERDVLVYDGSGKLFLFDGATFKCRKIVADLGKGEVSALAVRDGWVYVLCRYRLALEVFKYKDPPEP